MLDFNLSKVDTKFNMNGLIGTIMVLLGAKAKQNNYKATKGDKVFTMFLAGLFISVIVPLIILFIIWSNNGYKF